jgi:CheY-like chemotaxis protein
MTEKILIIDDDVQLCGVVAEFLRRHGYEVETAVNGRQGLQAIAEYIPDLILCDLNMPEVDGHGVVTALRQDRRLSEVPVIFLSGCTGRDQIRRSMNLGGDDFITKPASLPEIHEAVHTRLNRLKEQRRLREADLTAAGKYLIDQLQDAKPAGPGPAQDNPVLKRVEQLLLLGGDAPPAAHDQPTPADTLLVKCGNRRQFIKLTEVKVVTANGEYSMVHWGQGQKMLLRKPLKQWLKELPAVQFVRIHRQAIINLAFIDFMEEPADGQLIVHLKESDLLFPVSQRGRSRFNRSLKAFKGG